MRRLVLAMVLAVAAPAGSAEVERPWAVGVPNDQQTKALDLFKDANGKLRDAHYAAAREQYLAALAVWNHPAIHFNLGLALLNLDQPVEAYEHLVEAVKYGAAPMDQDKLEQALRYKSLLDRQLTRLTVRCALQDAIVRFDGRQLFVGPGRWEGMVRAGAHAIVGTHEGYVPVERAEIYVGGETKEIELSMFRTEELTEYRRRWTPAIEWGLLVGGVAVIGGGVGLRFAAQGAYSQFDAGVLACATTVSLGCTPRPEIARLRARGDAFQALSITAFAVGGVALVTGSILAYLNRLQPFIRTLRVTASVAPTLFPGPGALLRVELP